MSSLWTPDGEKPVKRAGGTTPTGGEPPPTDPSLLDEEAMAHQVEEMRKQLADAPAEVVVANHCYGLFELAAVYLSQSPPLLQQSRLAIDALSAVVDGLEGRLGENEAALRDAVAQIRLAWVQIQGGATAGNGSGVTVPATE